MIAVGRHLVAKVGAERKDVSLVEERGGEIAHEKSVGMPVALRVLCRNGMVAGIFPVDVEAVQPRRFHHGKDGVDQLLAAGGGRGGAGDGPPRNAIDCYRPFALRERGADHALRIVLVTQGLDARDLRGVVASAHVPCRLERIVLGVVRDKEVIADDDVRQIADAVGGGVFKLPCRFVGERHAVLPQVRANLVDEREDAVGRRLRAVDDIEDAAVRKRDLRRRHRNPDFGVGRNLRVDRRRHPQVVAVLARADLRIEPNASRREGRGELRRVIRRRYRGGRTLRRLGLVEAVVVRVGLAPIFDVRDVRLRAVHETKLDIERARVAAQGVVEADAEKRFPRKPARQARMDAHDRRRTLRRRGGCERDTLDAHRLAAYIAAAMGVDEFHLVSAFGNRDIGRHPAVQSIRRIAQRIRRLVINPHDERRVRV